MHFFFKRDKYIPRFVFYFTVLNFRHKNFLQGHRIGGTSDFVHQIPCYSCLLQIYSLDPGIHHTAPKANWNILNRY